MILPYEISLTDWAASLIIDFPTDNIPNLESEEKWQEWGDLLIQEQSFEQADAPLPELFETWQPWAEQVFYALANN